MFAHTQQPQKRCSKCGSFSFHHFDVDVNDLKSKSHKTETWIQCNICHHKKLESTLTRSSYGSPSIYKLPPKPEFEDF